MRASDLKRDLLKKGSENDEHIPTKNLLSFGSTLLNLACSDRVDGGLTKGVYHNIVGDSDTGKSVIGMTILAEASLNSEFKKYQLIYNNAERAKLLGLDKFPPELGKRLVTVESNSPEEFYYDLDDRVSKGPVVYILDSMDSLIPEAEEKKFSKNKKAFQKGQEGAGSYGFKAKVNAANLNRACSKIKKNGSILVIVSQTHDNLGAVGGYGPKKTRSGGYAMKFYTRQEVWLSVREILKKSHKGKQIQTGTRTKCAVKKNHITGKRREVEISIYNDFGIEDTEDCINFLIEWRYWKGTKTEVQAPEFEFKGSKDELIKKIEQKESRLIRLRKIVGKVWTSIERSVKLDRKPKYS